MEKHGPWREKYRPEKLLEMAPTFDREAVMKHFSSTDRSQVYMLSGETGTGKTSLAYILGTILNCAEATSTIDWKTAPCGKCRNCLRRAALISDMNMADKTKIDDARLLISEVTQKPMVGGIKRVVILDEAHAMTQQAQKAWLKVIENPRPHLYVFFCTTEPNGFLDDLRNRCTHIKFERLQLNPAIKMMADIVHIERGVPKITYAGVDWIREDGNKWTDNETKLVTGLKEIHNRIGGRPRELVEALQIWVETGKITQSKEVNQEAKLGDIVYTMLDGRQDKQAWTKIWETYTQIMEETGGSAEGIRRKMLYWLWKMADSPNSRTPLTKIMYAMEGLSQELPADEGSKFAMIARIFNIWKTINDTN